MARKDRTGNRRSRDQRPPVKIPELGYYLVVTDTEATERLSKTFSNSLQHTHDASGSYIARARAMKKWKRRNRQS